MQTMLLGWSEIFDFLRVDYSVTDKRVWGKLAGMDGAQDLCAHAARLACLFHAYP